MTSVERVPTTPRTERKSEVAARRKSLTHVRSPQRTAVCRVDARAAASDECQESNTINRENVRSKLERKRVRDTRPETVCSCVTPSGRASRPRSASSRKFTKHRTDCAPRWYRCVPSSELVVAGARFTSRSASPLSASSQTWSCSPLTGATPCSGRGSRTSLRGHGPWPCHTAHSHAHLTYRHK